MNDMVDVVCNYCGERIIEIGRKEAFNALANHDCIEAQAFGDTVEGRIGQWQRITA